MPRRSIQIDDLYRIRLALDPHVAPAGDQVCYSVKCADRAANKYFSHLWIMPLHDGAARQFTQGAVADGLGRWSPDGATIAFVRTTDGASQVWLIPVHGGEAWALTTLEKGSISALEWSPDGTRLAFLYRKTPQFPENTKDTAVPIARHITNVFHKNDGVGFFDGERTHLWTVDLAGTATQLTSGDWDDAGIAWSPDGRQLITVANRHPDLVQHPNEDDLWCVPADGGAARCLATGFIGPKQCPAWSPDGTRIAFYGNDDPTSWGIRNTHVWVVPAAGGTAIDCMPTFDRSCEDYSIADVQPTLGAGGPPCWSADGTRIYCGAMDHGRHLIYHVPATGGTPTACLNAPLVCGKFCVTANGTIVAMATAPARPSDLVVIQRGEWQWCTAINAEWLQDVTVAEPEAITVPTAAGEVHGWLLKPPDFDPARRYPLCLQIHGGPRCQYADAYYHEFQCLAAAGYVVLYINPRGSQGYGEAFAKVNLGNWGDPAYEELMASVDHVIQRHGWIDPDRLAVLGGSYGGYMAAWIIGHTDRFKAAIAGRGCYNLVSMMGTSDSGYLDPQEFLGTPWDDLEKLWRMSPIAYVKAMKTPLLILHNEGDLRCSIEQAEQLFCFLKVLGREVELVRFPEESHGLSRGGRPDRRICRLTHILRWLTTHLQ